MVEWTTWTKLWSLNAILASSWDIYIHHENVDGYCIALPKPKNNTILAPYCSKPWYKWGYCQVSHIDGKT
jgi:hypothetical protein